MERQLGKVCRKTAMRLVDGGEKRVDVTPDSLRELLGVVRYQDGVHSTRDQVGVVNGLAWTEVGGEILEVEAGVMEAPASWSSPAIWVPSCRSPSGRR